MTLFVPAILVALFTYLGGAQTPWLFGKTGGFYVVGRPLVAGLVVGLIFNDLPLAILCSIAVQILYLATVQTDHHAVDDICYGAYAGIALTVAATNPHHVDARQPWMAVVIAYLIGKLFKVLFAKRREQLAIKFNEQAASEINKGSKNKLGWYYVCLPQIINFLYRAVPMFLIIFFGTPLLNWFIDGAPDTLLDILSAIGWIIPVVGLVTLMSTHVKLDRQLVPLLVGFLMVGALGVTMYWLFAIGLVGFIIYQLVPTKKPATEENKVVE